MKIPTFLLELIRADPQVSSNVGGAIARFEPWIGNSQMPLFPEYTDHSLTHIEDVMATAVDIATAKARKLLSVRDAATLVLAICLHDAAMHLTEDGFFSLVRTDSAWRPVREFDRQPWDVLWEDFLSDARRFDGRKLMALFGDTEPIRRPPEKVTDLSKRDRLLMGEFVRRHHARLAHEIALHGIPGVNGGSVELIDRSSEWGGWLADLAGVTARSHGMPLRATVGYLHQKYHIRDFNGVHAAFLMVLVRIADYLQIQAKRAPSEVLLVRKLASPVSQGEWKVHASVRNITRADDDPEAVPVDARPPDVGSYLRIRGWLDGIQGELDMAWAVLGEVYGRYSQEHLNELGIELRRVRSNLDDIERFAGTIDYVPSQISFEAANPDLLKLLVGPLYGDRPEIGLRELIQNAVDAVREIDEILPRRSDLQAVERIGQETDVKIIVQCERDPNNTYRLIPIALIVADRGVGMNLDIVQNYFLKVGASFRRSDAWRKEFESEAGHSRVLRSGRFGVGALAAFLIGDRIEVKSRHVESPPDRGIGFSAGLDDDSVPLSWISCPVGTTITVSIPPGRRQAVQDAFDRYDLRQGSEISYTDGLCQYLGSRPSVERIIEVAGAPSLTLKVKGSLPDEGEVARAPWRSFGSRNYSRIFWTYDRSVPYLTCNGIVVVDHGEHSHSVPPIIRSQILDTPHLLVYDRDGKLPLNLQRTGLTTGLVDFAPELLADVSDDLIAYALVSGPEDLTSRPTPEWFRGRYEGFHKEGYARLRTPHHWFLSRSGFGLVEPGLACLGAAPAFLVAYSMAGLDPAPSKGLQDYMCKAADLLPDNLRLMFCEGPHYDAVNERKFVARALFEWDHPYYSAIPFNLKGLKMGGRRVFLQRSLLERFQRDRTFGRQLRSIVSDTKAVTMNDAWAVFSDGVPCPAPMLTIESPLVLDAKETSIVAIVEWYPAEDQNAKSSVAERWMKILGTPIIPFDHVERKRVFQSAYENLKPHIDLWQARMAQDLAKAEDGLSNAEEDLDADGGIGSN